MYIDFNKEMREAPEERIPELVVNHLSIGLPEGTKYVMDDNGNLILTSTTGQLTIGGLQLEYFDEFKEKIGQNPSKGDILRYSYNAQKPLRFKPFREGYLKVNGEEMPIDKFVYNPDHKANYTNGELIIKPPPFPEGENITVGCETYSRIIKVHQIENDSLNECILQSEQDGPLRLKLKINSKEKTCIINVTVALEYAKSIQDIVESIYIYNAFVDNKGTINGEEANVTREGEEIFKFNENYALFWKKTLEVENILNKNCGIKFSPPDGDLHEDEIAVIEELFQSLILHKPVRRAEHITSLGGNSQINEIINLEEIKNQKLLLVYSQAIKIEIFGAAFRVLALSGIVDAIVSDYKIEDDRVILLFEDDEEGGRPFESRIDFLDEKEMKNYQKETETSLEKLFEEAESLDELVDAVLSADD